MNTWAHLAARATAAAAIIAALLAAPAVTLAQTGSVPTYAHPSGETIKGTIKSFDGAYKMYVRDVHGYVDDVTLHQGTIINPTGIRLQSGYPVTIEGHANGNTFEADQIDTPFHATTYYAYPYYAYPYPYYGSANVGWGWGRPWGWRP